MEPSWNRRKTTSCGLCPALGALALVLHRLPPGFAVASAFAGSENICKFVMGWVNVAFPSPVELIPGRGLEQGDNVDVGLNGVIRRRKEQVASRNCDISGSNVSLILCCQWVVLPGAPVDIALSARGSQRKNAKVVFDCNIPNLHAL